MRSDDEVPTSAPDPAAPVAHTAAPSVGSDPLASGSEGPLLPPGNAARPKQLIWAVLGLVPVALLMACDRHFSLSVPIASIGLVIASIALLDALGTFDDPSPMREVHETLPTFRSVAPRLLELGAAIVLLTFGLRWAVQGSLPRPLLSSGLLVSAGSLAVLVATCRAAQAFGVFRSDDGPFFARRGFWLVVSNVLLYVPLLGGYSLSDPWETHYGEVAREMLARDDWLSLWWAQDGWFWSKPVLDFWLQGLAFSLTGVHYLPDQMLAGASAGLAPAPEWAARFPIICLTIPATYLFYKAVAKAFGGRAGLIAGVVLTSAPYWYLIAHQSMTDMPYVAPLTAALALVALGMQTDAQSRVRSYPLRVGPRVLEVSAFHLLFACVLLAVLPQLLYLLTRNVTLQLSPPNYGFRFHWDEFFSGSGGGNCGLPGNEACRFAEPVNRLFQPAVGALVWGVALCVLLYVNRGERRVQRLYFLAAWFFTALSALSKGAPGLVLPVVIAFTALAAVGRYRDFANSEWVGLGLMFACVCLPWYVQMYMRHGPGFTDRLLFHDMYKRAFVHVHDTNTGDDVSFRYYVWQLGYGLFPWTGFGAAGLLFWMRAERGAKRGAMESLAFMMLWFVISFSMFTITLTKFHHYALPTVPPIAALTGVMLDRAFGTTPWARRGRASIAYYGALFGSTLLAVYGLTTWFGGTLGGRLAPAHSPAVLVAIGGALLGASALLAVYGVRIFGAKATASDSPGWDPAYQSAVLSLLGIASAAALLLVGRDLSTSLPGDIDGQARLMHLFTYNYRRPWPSGSLDFRAVLRAFSAVFALCSLGFALPSLRRHALAAFVVLSLTWTAWGLDVYLIEAAPHWGQRETILAYYAARKGPREPFVAYQMNWKGENFYTGNRVPAFVSTGAKFKSWVAEQKKKGTQVMFFTTEHSRVSALKSELGTVNGFELLTSRELNNKFALVRVEL